MKYSALGFFLFLFTANTVFAEVQQVNPLFTQAQASAQQVAASSLGADLKEDFKRRWDALDREQKQLWMIAGQVDAAVAAGNQPAFGDNYNQRVTAWQNNLQAFTADAQRALAEPQGSSKGQS